MMGSLIKDWWALKYLDKLLSVHKNDLTSKEKTSLRRKSVYHVTVMPCYDKKLEASRPDFMDADGIRDVDCVLTTGEVFRMLREKNALLETLPVDSISAQDFVFPELLPHFGSSSGSYLHSVISSVVLSTPSTLLNSLFLDVQPIRGADYVSYSLCMEIPPSLSQMENSSQPARILFRGATCYGFRNLQNLVRKIRPQKGVSPSEESAVLRFKRGVNRRKALPSGGVQKPNFPDLGRPYDYIEVMACPSGCINGGGQLPPSTTAPLPLPLADAQLEELHDLGTRLSSEAKMPSMSSRDWLKNVEQIYWMSDIPPHSDCRRAGLHPTIAPFLDQKDQRYLDAEELARQIVREVCLDKPQKSSFLRTQYRPLDQREAQGFTVSW